MIIEYNNVLHITGKKEELERFKNNFKGKPAYITSNGKIYTEKDDAEDFIKSEVNWFKNLKEVFTFNALIPMPDDVILQHFYDRIEWMNENWGVEEDVYDLLEKEEEIILDEISEDEHEYRFYISDGPLFPKVLLKKVSKDYPDLDFFITYFNHYKNKSGRFNVVNGKVVKDEISSDKKRCREIIYTYTDYEFDYICNECGSMMELSDFDAFVNFYKKNSTAKCYHCDSENLRDIHTGRKVYVEEIKKAGRDDVPF